jgi:hypothetical protein
MWVRLLVIAGMASMLGALLSLSTPLHLHSIDRSGSRIPCGTGLDPRYEVARDQDQISVDENLTRGPAFTVSNYEAQCRDVLSERRSVAVPVGAAGGVTVLLAAALSGTSALRRRQHRDIDCFGSLSPRVGGSSTSVAPQQFRNAQGLPVMSRPLDGGDGAAGVPRSGDQSDRGAGRVAKYSSIGIDDVGAQGDCVRHSFRYVAGSEADQPW